MQISHRLRRLAAVLLLVPLSAGIQPLAAAERTQTANVRRIASLASVDIVNAPKSPRSDMLLASDGNLYFASSAGGKGFGGVGKLAPDGTVTAVYSFSDGAEGLSAFGGLAQGRDGHLYGTTYFGGAYSTGTVFRVTLDGVFTKLHEFGESDKTKEPKFPYTGLVQGTGSDDSFYGTTRLGGANNKGTIYRITASGEFSVIYNFGGSDGEEPQGRLVAGSDGSLYGTTVLGGSGNRGVIYRITAAGVYTRLYSFPSLRSFNEFGAAINSTGANPRAGLIRVAGAGGDTFYGTAYQGGDHGNGTLFRAVVSGDSATVTTVHSFGGWPFDGGFPLSAPVLGPDGNFYGTTLQGGYNVIGAVWKVTPAGASEMLHSAFGGGEDGSQLYASVAFDALGNLLAISNTDDVGGAGVIFKVEQQDSGGNLPVNLSVSATEVVVNSKATITWSAPAAVTCDKFGSWNESTVETEPKFITPTAGSEEVDPAIGLYTYGLACTDATGLVHNGYVALLVTAPPLETVDGGQIVGGGSLSLLLLALFAALLVRKILKETRSSCP
jgi:uncharacterized repeat protein (TIGR03803 family)